MVLYNVRCSFTPGEGVDDEIMDKKLVSCMTFLQPEHVWQCICLLQGGEVRRSIQQAYPLIQYRQQWTDAVSCLASHRKSSILPVLLQGDIINKQDVLQEITDCAVKKTGNYAPCEGYPSCLQVTCASDVLHLFHATSSQRLSTQISTMPSVSVRPPERQTAPSEHTEKNHNNPSQFLK